MFFGAVLELFSVLLGLSGQVMKDHRYCQGGVGPPFLWCGPPALNKCLGAVEGLHCLQCTRHHSAEKVTLTC